MKMLNKKFVRTLSGAAVAVGAAAMLSVGAFAAEVDSTCVEGYLPPQEQMVQGDIALHSADVAIGEKDPTYGGYGAPEGNPIQGNIMLISGDELAAAISAYAPVFVSLFSGMLIAKDRTSSFLTRLFASPMTAADFTLGYSLAMLVVALAQTLVT